MFVMDNFGIREQSEEIAVVRLISLEKERIQRNWLCPVWITF